LYENQPEININANGHFICSITALKARNNRISNQNPSDTTQNHARSFQNSVLAHSLIAVPGYIRKNKKTKKQKTENFVYSPIRVTSKSVGKRVCNVIRTVSG